MDWPLKFNIEINNIWKKSVWSRWDKITTTAKMKKSHALLFLFVDKKNSIYIKGVFLLFINLTNGFKTKKYTK